MAIFRIGDRVRVKNSRNHPELIGETGTVLGPAPPDNWADGVIRHGHLYVGLDCWGGDFTHDSVGYNFSPHPDNLEPLTRPDASTETDRNAIVEWSDCEWMPDHLKEKV